MKRLTILVLLVVLLPFIGQAQKSGGGNKAKGKPPAQEPPSIFPNSQLPAEIVVREGNRIFVILVTREGTPSWTYYDDTFNAFGGIHFEVGDFTEFRAVRMGGVVSLLFRAERLVDPNALGHPPVSLAGSVDLDFAQGFFTIFTTGKGLVRFDILDNSRPSTMVASQNVCVTTQFVPMRCASAFPPGFEPHQATH